VQNDYQLNLIFVFVRVCLKTVNNFTTKTLSHKDKYLLTFSFVSWCLGVLAVRRFETIPEAQRVITGGLF